MSGEKLRIPVHFIRTINNYVNENTIGDKFYIESDGGNVLKIEVGVTASGILFTDLEYLVDEEWRNYAKEIRNGIVSKNVVILIKSDKW